MLDPPNDAIVVRGGASRSVDLLVEQAIAARGTLGMFSLSVFVGLRDEAATVEEIVELVAREAPIPNLQVRVTTARAIRDAGFEFVKTGRPRHYSVDIGSLEVGMVQRFIDTFEEPRRNPHEVA